MYENIPERHFMDNNHVSWEELLQFCLVIIGIITLCIMCK